MQNIRLFKVSYSTLGEWRLIEFIWLRFLLSLSLLKENNYIKKQPVKLFKINTGPDI